MMLLFGLQFYLSSEFEVSWIEEGLGRNESLHSVLHAAALVEDPLVQFELQHPPLMAATNSVLAP